MNSNKSRMLVIVEQFDDLPMLLKMRRMLKKATEVEVSTYHPLQKLHVEITSEVSYFHYSE